MNANIRQTGASLKAGSGAAWINTDELFDLKIYMYKLSKIVITLQY